MACLIILFNWFPLSLSGFIVALWQASYLFIPFVTEIFNIDTSQNYAAGCLVVALMYMILAAVCHFYFHHHPSHIGVKVQQKGAKASGGGNFFLDLYNGASPNMRMTPSLAGRIRHATILDAFQFHE
jgi:hypothetical protein